MRLCRGSAHAGRFLGVPLLIAVVLIGPRSRWKRVRGAKGKKGPEIGGAPLRTAEGMSCDGRKERRGGDEEGFAGRTSEREMF